MKFFIIEVLKMLETFSKITTKHTLSISKLPSPYTCSSLYFNWSCDDKWLLELSSKIEKVNWIFNHTELRKQLSYQLGFEEKFYYC